MKQIAELNVVGRQTNRSEKDEVVSNVYTPESKFPNRSGLNAQQMETGYTLKDPNNKTH